MSGHQSARLASRCEAFNARHSAGTVVDVRKDGGETIRTRTRASASVLSGHSAVIWLEDMSGCCALERVAAPKPTADQRKLLEELAVPGAWLRRETDGWFVHAQPHAIATVDICTSLLWLEQVIDIADTFIITDYGREALAR